MESQKRLIAGGDWDVLLVLDACRFDTFEETYPDYLPGSLQKVRSPASCTINWLKENFTSFYGETTYVSASPYVNSRGVSREGWNAVDHFQPENIIDVWDTGWDDEQQTVLPSAVAGVAEPILQNRTPEQKVIVHFMQPHAPYLTIEHNYTNREGKQRERDDVDWYRTLKRTLGPPLLKLTGMTSIFRIKKALGLNPTIDGEEMWRELDRDVWRRAYRDNLVAALEVLPSLIEKSSGKVVVTADHGEALGDDGLYLHPMGMDVPVLREVPWHTVRP